MVLSDAVVNRVTVTVYLGLVYEVYRFEAKFPLDRDILSLMREAEDFEASYLPLFDGRVPIAGIKSTASPFVRSTYDLYVFQVPIRVRKSDGAYVLLYNGLWWTVNEVMLRSYFRPSRRSVIVQPDGPAGRPHIWEAELWNPKPYEEVGREF